MAFHRTIAELLYEQTQIIQDYLATKNTTFQTGYFLIDAMNDYMSREAIHEYSSNNEPYTKDIIIVFDNKNEYRILSPRSKTLLDDCIRKDIIFESVK